MADVDLRSLERSFRANPTDAKLEAQLVYAYKRAGMFAIEETSTDYIMYNVPHVRIVRNEPVRDIFVNITLSKNWLDNGRPHTQQEWVKIAKKQGYELPDSLTIYSICRALYQNFQAKHAQQTKIIEVRNTFIEYFKKYSMTSTRIIYQEKKPDYIIHRWATKKDQTIQTEMRHNQPNPHALENAPFQTRAILGTDDINEANQVLKWAINTKNNPAIWLMPLPKQKDERVVVLGRNVFINWFSIICNYVISISWPARGVVIE